MRSVLRRLECRAFATGLISLRCNGFIVYLSLLSTFLLCTISFLGLGICNRGLMSREHFQHFYFLIFLVELV